MILLFFVYKYQKSDKCSLPINNEPTCVKLENNKTILQLHHPAEAHENNLQAYISTLLCSLQCRMDLQTSDGHGLLLKYVSAYVSKSHDAFHSSSLYTMHTTPYEAAYRHLREMKALEPEMWLTLSSKKVAWTPHRCKNFVVPLYSNTNENKIIQRYWNRPSNHEHFTLLQWLCNFDHTKTSPSAYKRGQTFVGVKCISVFKDEYFFQYLLLHVKHCNTEELQVDNFHSLSHRI